MLLGTLVVMAPFCKAMDKQTFVEKRAALIIKHSHHDGTFAVMQNENSFSPEYWRWRLDQYMYGQYPEYQVIYDAYTQNKSFLEIYQLPKENLGPKFKVPTNLPELPDGYFTGNLHGNSHTGWHTVVNDTIYITYQGHLTDPYVASYNVNSGEWKGPYQAGVSTLTKGDRKLDSHGRPIIEVDSKGYIHIIFGGHGGEREDGLNPMSIDTPHAGGRMLHVVSTKPYDISEFVEKDDINPFASYAKSFQMGNGDIYFFTRGGTHKSPWLYYKMKNGSQRFEPPVVITWPTVDKRNPILVDTFYINPLKVSDTEIVISSLWHACNFKEEHDRTHYNRLNAYYMSLDTSDDTFYNVKGEKLNLPITFESATNSTLAYDSQSAGETSFGTRPLVLGEGQKALAYQAMGEGYREWRMAKFANNTWTHGLPMPGTVDRTVYDAAGTKISNIQALEAFTDKQGKLSAAVLYKTDSGDRVFAMANSLKAKSDADQHWQVSKEHLQVANAQMQMKPVHNAAGETIALVINVRKGHSQRLYLWHNGEFKQNH